jgi:dihydroorotate dehydrogenase electron transfer subunit
MSEYLIEKVFENIEIAKGIFKLTIIGNFKGKPGQFYMLRAWEHEPLLSRPISINNIDDKITFLYQPLGEGTKLLAKLKSGDELKLIGPLGNGFPLEAISGKIAVVAGGMGIAPMNFVCKVLEGKQVDLYCGFKDEVYGVDNVEKIVRNVYIATESGSNGYKGFVTEIFKAEKYDVVLCCGPEVMMEKIAITCLQKGVPIYVSMEKHMACGVGACLVCSYKTINGNKRACKDGPVFLGSEVIFDA